MDYENRILDYLSGTQAKLGLVQRAQGAKLQVTDGGGRVDRVNPKQILVVHGACELREFPRRAEDLAARLTAQAAEIDLDLLWNAVCERPDALALDALAAEYFGEATADERSALARALLTDTTRFKRNGLLFTPRNAVEIGQLTTRVAREAERAAERERLTAWGREVIAGKAETTPVPVDCEDFIGLVLAFMLQGHRNEAPRILEAAFPKRTPRETGLALLEKTGRIPEGADPFLLVHGVMSGFSESVLAHAAALPRFAAEPAGRREDLTAPDAFSIDDAETREIDDALAVVADGARVIVFVHIADPAVFVHRDDPVDRVAAERPLTLYLPTTTVTMLPERIGCDLASLQAGELRPAISFRIVFDADGMIEDWRLARAEVRLAQRLTYDEAEARLGADSLPLAAALRRLDALAATLRAQRLATGALVLRRPEIVVRVRDGRPEVKRIDPDSPARRLVSEFMILANSLAAQYALRHDVPIIYRSQEKPKNAVPSMEQYDPLLFERIVRNLKRTRLSTHPLPHAGLGLDIYTQVSSPIRRFTDLVMQRQLAAHLAGEPCPYSDLELIEILTAADSVEAQNRQLERAANRYWLLEHLRCERAADTFAATLVPDRAPMVELAEFAVRARLTNAPAGKPGDRLAVRISAVEPARDLLCVVPA